MIKKLFSLEEQQTIGIFCVAEIITLSLAYMLVMVFLNGDKDDNIVLAMVVYCLIVYLIRNRFTTLAKCMLSCSSALFSVVTIVSNSGRYGAIAATYFLFLVISMAHYDKLQVILSSASILVTNIAGFIFFTDAYLKIHNKTVWLFILFIYIMAAICAYMITYRTHNLFQKEQQLQLSELQLANLRQIEKKNEEHSKFIHNMHHYFSAIGNLATQQDYKNILNILKDLNLEITKQESIVYTTHKVANAILSEKYSVARTENIAIDIYFEPNISLKNISDGDIVIMLGNLLDNAIEASLKSDDDNRFIKVRGYHANSGQLCAIKIENYFSSPVKRLGNGNLESTKTSGLHGFGIKSVDQTAKKYGGFLKCTTKNNVFTALLILSDKNNILN